MHKCYIRILDGYAHPYIDNCYIKEDYACISIYLSTESHSKSSKLCSERKA